MCWRLGTSTGIFLFLLPLSLGSWLLVLLPSSALVPCLTTHSPASFHLFGEILLLSECIGAVGEACCGHMYLSALCGEAWQQLFLFQVGSTLAWAMSLQSSAECIPA